MPYVSAAARVDERERVSALGFMADVEQEGVMIVYDDPIRADWLHALAPGSHMILVVAKEKGLGWKSMHVIRFGD